MFAQITLLPPRFARRGTEDVSTRVSRHHVAHDSPGILECADTSAFRAIRPRLAVIDSGKGSRR